VLCKVLPTQTEKHPLAQCAELLCHSEQFGVLPHQHLDSEESQSYGVGLPVRNRSPLLRILQQGKREILRLRQSVYFCCHQCIHSFRTDSCVDVTHSNLFE